MPTATLADLQTKAGYVLDLANKLLVDNAQPLHQTIENAQTFSMALARNTSGVDAALQGMADLGKTIQPLAARLQVLSDDADRLVKAIEPDKVRSIVDNIQSLSGKAGSVLDRADKLIAENSDAIQSTLSDASGFSKTLNNNSANVDAALKGLADLGKTIQPLDGALAVPVRGRGQARQGDRHAEGQQRRRQRPDLQHRAGQELERLSNPGARRRFPRRAAQ